MLRFLLLNFIVVLLCVSVVHHLYVRYKQSKTDKKVQSCIESVIVSSFVISVLTAFMFTLVYVKEAFYTVHIYSLQSSSALSSSALSSSAGTFYLGSGRFESRDQYFTYVKHEDGFRRYSFPADDVTIVQYDGAPKMIMTHGVYADDMLSRFYGMANQNSSMLPITPVKIYVPKNTIVQKFSVD